MAAIGNTGQTLLDLINSTNPDGSIAQVVEALQKRNPILQDIPVKKGNLPTGDKFTSRTALPSPTYRKFNQGVKRTKSAREQITEGCAQLEAYSQVDCGLADISPNPGAYRATEDQAFLQGFNIEVSQGVFYNSTTGGTPEKFHGLTPRMNATAGNPAAGQIIKGDAAASGADQTSIWLVGWGLDTVCGITPSNSGDAGFKTEDLGKQLVPDENGDTFTAWVTHYKWLFGLEVKDYRYLVRGCNIDTSNWRADLSAGTDIAALMADMVSALYDTQSVMPRFYMTRQAAAMLNKQCLKRGGNDFLGWIDSKTMGGSLTGQGGYGTVMIPTFLGIPVRVVDALTNTESVVV